MWIVSAAVAFALAIAAHAAVSRLRVPLNMVTRFVAPGAPIGIALLAVLLRSGNTGIEVIAGLLCYALTCEVYIFVFTMVSSSVTVSLLLRLRRGPAEWSQLDADYSDAIMVDGRMAKLEANGLITSSQAGVEVTPRGEALVSSFDRLRRFFRHPGFEASGSLRLARRVEAHTAAGQDVG
jgi:hypothetical protein